MNPRHPHIGQIAGGVLIGGEATHQPEYLDLLGHGTAVTAAIQEKAPDADIYAVKIFDTALRAKTGTLLQAMEWTIREDMNLVNLSLGTTNMQRADEFRSLLARAEERGVRFVAAKEANGQPCLPGCLPGVIAVALDSTLDRNAYRCADGVFYASGYPRPIPGRPQEHNLQGISFAVANITGLAAHDPEIIRTFFNTAAKP